MNFFKSVFSDDPDPPQTNNALQNKDQDAPDRDSSPAEHRYDVGPSPDASGVWNFRGLIKTLSAKSESIIEIYRRDLQEFGTGLKKEIAVAQGSLQTVGHAIDEFGDTVVKGTSQIISQGKDAILAADFDSDSDINNKKHGSQKSLNSKRYSRFDSLVRTVQGDASTYSVGPEDLSNYNKWKSEFSLEGKSEEMESFLRENDAMESIYKRIVPNTADHETFWYRYYYKVYKLKKAEDVRARLVRRMSKEEEDLSWDVEDDDDDDEEEEEEYVIKAEPDLRINKEVGSENQGEKGDVELQVGSSASDNVRGTRRLNVEEVHNSGVEDKFVEESRVENSEVVRDMGDGCKETIKEAGVDKAPKAEVDKTVNKNDSAAESDDKLTMERKVDDGKLSNKSNDSTVVASVHSAHEEDLGWDEIEDLSFIDEKKATQSGSPRKVDLRKRLSAAEEEEDLNWDIEDDDEPAKA